jgi:spermidine synthase
MSERKKKRLLEITAVLISFSEDLHRKMFHVKHGPTNAAGARAALYSLGALCALAELLLLREVLFLAGGTELAASLMLAAWLLAGAFGALSVSRRLAFLSPGTLLAACAVLLPAQITALRLLRGFLAGSAGELPSVFTLLLLGGLLCCPLPVILGAIFPLAARTLGRRGTARAYAIETAGLCTGAGLTLALAGMGREYLAVALLAGLFILCGMLLVQRKKFLVALALVPLAAAIAGPWAVFERATVGFAFRIPGVKSFASTPQGRAFSARHGPETHIYAGGLAETSLESANEVVELALAMKNSPQNVLVICDDPEGYARTLATLHKTHSNILAPDPGVLDFKRKERPFPTAGNVDVSAREPLQYLRKCRTRHDIVIVTAGAPLSARNNRFFTLGFYKKLHSRLTREGVLAVELPYSPGHVSSELGALAGSIWRTLGEVFSTRRIALTQHAGSLLFFASSNTETATRHPQAPSAREEARKSLGLHAPVDYEGAFSSTRTLLARSMLEARQWPANTVANPACYRLALVHSQRRFGPPGFLAWFWELRFLHWLGVAGAAGAVLFLLSLLRGGGYGPASCALGGGLCSMTAQVIIIYIFQSAYGLLYSHIGLLYSTFMAGALAGAVYGRRFSSAKTAFGLLVGLALFCGALPFLLSIFAGSGHFAVRYIAFPGTSALAGILTGALFPACSNLVPEKDGGRIYAADLAGASAGALLGGLVLIPSLGLHSTAFLTCCAGVLLAFALLPAIITRSRISGNPS